MQWQLFPLLWGMKLLIGKEQRLLGNRGEKNKITTYMLNTIKRIRVTCMPHLQQHKNKQNDI